MDRHRGERSGDRFGDRPGDRSGDGVRHSRMPSRWSSDSPTNQTHRFPRGGGGAGGTAGGTAAGTAGSAGGGDGFSGGRYHPYRGHPDYPPAGGGGGPGFRGSQGFRDGPGGFGGHQMPMGGQKRGFAGRGASPEYGEGTKFAKLFIGSVPKTATEEDIRPLFEEHGDVIEVALIKERRTGQQQGCCFIKYATSEHAERAIRALHNQYTLPGGTGPIQVRYADGERERLGTIEDKLFVASLNKRATEKEVEEIFAPYGHVEDVYLMKDEMKQSRGCGFVKFSSKDMALAAMNALHGAYVMRGCDQPLIVRFADPKRPRPSDQRSGPAFGGPGFGPRSDAVIPNRQRNNFDEPVGGHMPHKGWDPLSPQSGGPQTQSSAHGFGSYMAVKSGIPPTMAAGPGSFGDVAPSSNGSLPNLVPIPSASQQQTFNPSIAQAPSAIGQQMLKSPVAPQNFPPSLPLQNTLLPPSHTQSQVLQAPMQQLGQLQLPQSIGPNSFNHVLLAQQFPGLSGQLSASPSLVQQNTTASGQQNPLNLHQQGLPAVPNQQLLPASSISQQLPQQPVQQLPAQMLLQQQAQTLQSSYQSSQQAIFQIQQQLQMMQQSNLSQQQSSQNVKQQSSWTGPPATSITTASTPSTAIPSNVSATPSLPLLASTGTVTAACNWTEHTSPEGFKYYYNSVSRESKWEKPEELTVFEQQRQQKLLILQQQQQQKITAPQLKSPSHTPSQTQAQSIQQASQSQVQPQIQLRQQAQLQILQSSLAYQASGVAGPQSFHDLSKGQLHGTGSVVDPARVQQGIQVSQEWAWKNKPTGS